MSLPAIISDVCISSKGSAAHLQMGRIVPLLQQKLTAGQAKSFLVMNVNVLGTADHQRETCEGAMHASADVLPVYYVVV